jgi:alpha-tubulin suppressor-like RCC1 family protein
MRYFLLTSLFFGLASILPAQTLQGARSTPGQICGLSGVVAVSMLDFGGLALKSDGTVWEWTGESPPVQVRQLSSIVRIGAPGFSMALKSDGTVWEWTSQAVSDLFGVAAKTPYQVSDLTGVVAIAAGESWNLAVKSDGTVWEWTYQAVAELLGVPPEKPHKIEGLNDVVAVSQAFEWWWGNDFLLARRLALKSDGTVWFWDEGSMVGRGTIIGRVSELTDVVAISAGYPDNLALKRDGTVWEWSNLSGSGQVIMSTPVRVSDLTGVVAVAVGGAQIGYSFDYSPYGIALKGDGTVWAWGDNTRGQLGDGTTTSRPAPVQVSGIADIATIASSGTVGQRPGQPLSIAVKRDGTVWGWGGTWNAQVCNTTFFPQLAVGGGYSTTVALSNTGSTAISGNLVLRDQQGNAFTVSSASSGSGSSFPVSIPPGGTTSLTVNSLSPSDLVWSGWATIETTGGSLGAMETLQFGGVVQTTGLLPAQPMQFATIPVDDNYSQIRLTAYALANPTNQNLVIKLSLVDQDGNVVDDTVSITLGPWQQTARYVYANFGRPVFKGSLVLKAQGGKFVAVALVQNQQVFTEIPIIPSNPSNP